MFTASELLEALRARPQRGAVWFRNPDKAATRGPGELPPAWQKWLSSMPLRIAGVTGSTPQALAAIFAARPLARPPLRVHALNRWQAFATLWRQQWLPPTRDERGLRWSAAGVSVVLHVLFAIMLMWLMYLRFMLPGPVAEETVVQVEYIGTGTPEDTGGAMPAQAAPATAATAPTASAATAAAAAPAQPSPAPARPSAQGGAQPLRVTEVPAPDIDFTLPAPTPRIPDLPQSDIRVPIITAPTPDITVVEIPAPLPRPISVPARPTPAVQVPELTRPPPEIVIREVPAPLPQVTTRVLAEQPVRTPALQTPTPTVRTRDIPAAAAATAPATAPATPAASTTAAASASPSPRQAAAASSAAARPASDAGQANTAAAGKGPTASPRRGATPTPARGDDWGAAARNRPGAATGPRGARPGLFNADGSPRLAQTPPATGAPPGSIEQRIADLDRAGTWLKRPPYDYTPTRFERFWVPGETLLAEWVRKGIKSVAIPIPGTTKKLTCVVSLLQLGGGCGLSDPNLNEQPATARPPPDIPFKPELQEDNGSG